MNRLLHGFILTSAISLISVPGFTQVEEGDRHYAARAEGAQGSRARAARVDAAIAAYTRALTQSPGELEARWKLLRAMRFKSAYVASSKEQKKEILTQAKKHGEQGLAVLDRMLAARGARSVSKASEKQIADLARTIPHAGEMFYWDAVVWGEWALVYGKLAAVKEGVADRVKRDATIVMMMSPRIELGGGARVLGRLHNQTPRVPFLTGWASDRLAVKYLNESLAQDPSNKVTKVFLAEAMVANNSDTKPQAIQMLREVINSPNDPNYVVEHAAAQDDARALLKAWR